MRISFVIIIFAFLQYTVFSQEWNIYSNIDSLGNIIKPYDYITENEINEIFDVRNFIIEEISFENMSLLPMQVVSKDKIKLKRVSFFEDYLSDMRSDISLVYAGTSKPLDVIQSAKIVDFKKRFVGWRYIGLSFFTTIITNIIADNYFCSHQKIDDLIEKVRRDSILMKGLPYTIKIDSDTYLETTDDYHFLEGHYDENRVLGNIEFINACNEYRMIHDEVICYLDNASILDNKFLLLLFHYSKSKIGADLYFDILKSIKYRYIQREIDYRIVEVLIGGILDQKGILFRDSDFNKLDNVLESYLEIKSIPISLKLLIEECIQK